ncbi:hairy-related 2-like [Arapaima gigas]
MTPSSERRDPTPLSRCRKLRKPAVEKIRRDRINSSIEQLKDLLHAHAEQQQRQWQRRWRGDKLDKADILEMTVRLLKESVRSSSSLGREHRSPRSLQQPLRRLSGLPQGPAERGVGDSSGTDRKTAVQNKPAETSLSKCAEASAWSARPSRPSQGTLWRPW